LDWYPWYFLIYDEATMHLNPYQDGCYRRLIDHYMKTRSSLPDNDAALARIVGDSEANWVAMASPLVRPFFKSINGRLFLKRCEEILDYQDKSTKKLSESGKKGAEKRWSKIKDIDSHPIAPPLGVSKPSDSTSTSTITGSKKDTPIVPTADFEQFWQGWKPYDMDKGAKSKAKTSYEKARKETDHETIIRKRDEYLGECHSFKRRTQHAATWLNQKRWGDDYAKGRELASAGQSDQDQRISDRVNATAGFIDALTQD